MTAPGQAAMFRDTYVRGLAFACFFAVPAATAYLVLSGAIAGGIGFGAFGAADGRGLISAALGGLAPAIVGETLFLVTTYACYARKDTRNPLRGMVIQAIVCAAGIAAVVTTSMALLSSPALAWPFPRAAWPRHGTWCANYGRNCRAAGSRGCGCRSSKPPSARPS